MTDAPDLRTQGIVPAVSDDARASVAALQPRIEACVDRLEDEAASALEDAYRLLARYRERQEQVIAELMEQAHAEIAQVVGRVNSGVVGPAAFAEPDTTGVSTSLPGEGRVEADEEPTPDRLDELDLREAISERLEGMWAEGERFDEAFEAFWSGDPQPVRYEPRRRPRTGSAVAPEISFDPERSAEADATPPTVVAPPAIVEPQGLAVTETDEDERPLWRRVLVEGLKEIALPVILAMVLIPLILALGLVFF